MTKKLIQWGFIFIAKMPVFIRVALAWKLAALMLLLGQRRIKLLHENWAHCQPSLFPNQSISLSAFRVAFYHAIGLLDFISYLHISTTKLEKLFWLEGAKHLKNPKAILYAPHFVSLSCLSRYLTAIYTVSFIYSPSKHKPVASYMNDCYQRLGKGRAHRKNDSVIPLARALKKGEKIMLSTDLDVGSVFVNFCGKPAATSLVIPIFAKRFNAPILAVYAVYSPLPWQQQWVNWWRKTPSPRYRIVCEPLNIDNRQSPLAMQNEMHKWLEEKIKQHPEQYWWFHNRFKSKQEID